MTMTGGKDNCHGTYTRETLIKFTCDHSTDGKSGPIFIGKLLILYTTEVVSIFCLMFQLTYVNKVYL